VIDRPTDRLIHNIFTSTCITMPLELLENCQ